jgi:hypothetical protein
MDFLRTVQNVVLREIRIESGSHSILRHIPAHPSRAFARCEKFIETRWEEFFQIIRRLLFDNGAIIERTGNISSASKKGGSGERPSPARCSRAI